jgi:hypothetical protein
MPQPIAPKKTAANADDIILSPLGGIQIIAKSVGGHAQSDYEIHDFSLGRAMRYLDLLALGIVAYAASPPAFSADWSGQYIVGGGVGGLPCTQFLNAMAEARQEGGLTSIGGASRIAVWQEYVVGFETGYNFAMPGVRDIFGAFGPSPANDVLYGLEPWCQRNPTVHFGEALIIFAEGLRKGRQ